MENFITKIYRKARKENRLCSNCGWIITRDDWKKGFRECFGCRDGLKGVNVKTGYGRYRDEPVDMTGEM